MYCSMPKGMSWDEAMSNSEKIKPIALAVIELRLSEGIKQAGRRADGWAGGRVGGRAGRQAISLKKIPLNKFCNNL